MASRTPTFKEFWTAYPLHRDRLRAEKAWLRMTAADKAAAIAALPAYTADCRQRGVPFQYAQGWLNGRRWEDEMEESGTEKELSDAAQHSDKGQPTNGTAPSLADMETW